jgi:hypothetical protein
MTMPTITTTTAAAPATELHTPLMDAAMAVRTLPVRMRSRLGREVTPEPPARLPLRGRPPVAGWVERPFVRHIMRAVLATVAADAAGRSRP